VTILGEDVAVHHQPNGPAFDIVLILHVGCVVVSLVTLVTSATTAARLRRHLRGGAPLPEAVGRYFTPGVNWAGRSVYGIPVFGFALLALSHGAYSLRDGWIMAGLAILVGMVVVAEGTLWPAERRLQESVTPWREWTGEGAPAPDGPVMRDGRAVVISAMVTLALLVLGSALMIAQP
jgi:lysylphosphatidylglycerol synthetase-like protein (DUF2156 family)